MKLSFSIGYKTVFGEELVLNVTNQNSEGDFKESQFRMATVDGEHWQYDMNVPEKETPTAISYYYSVDADGIQRRREWQTMIHKVELSATKASVYRLYDHWTDIPEDSYLYSSAFTECINKRKIGKSKATSYQQTVCLAVRAPQLRANERLAIVGTGASLGDWDIRKAVAMTEHNFNEWCVNLDAQQFADGKLEFKFVALNDSKETNPMWEDGLNRTVLLPEMENGDVVVYGLNQVFLPHL
jgi:4-alpha-glucanotransferase